MVKTYAVAVSPDKSHFVLKRGMNYAVVNRKDGITKYTKWGSEKVLSSLRIKGDYRSFKKPVRYKGNEDSKVEKSRKAVSRIDVNSASDPKSKNKKRSKKEQLMIDLGVQNFSRDVKVPYTKSLDLTINLSKAGAKHLPKGAERNSYKTPSEHGIIHIPVNRLQQVYQTDEALNPKKIRAVRKEMRKDKPMDPVEIGYNYDVHDGHHRWHAAIGEGHTHVPCKVVGKDPKKVREAKSRYRRVWKSEPLEARSIVESWLSSFVDTLTTKRTKEEQALKSLDERGYTSTVREFGFSVNEESDFRKSIQDSGREVPKNWFNRALMKSELSLVLDLNKSDDGSRSTGSGRLNTSRLVRRRVAVQGKNGIFYRMQWVDPRDDNPNIVKPKEDDKEDQSSYSHHEDGLREMERRQSTRFPVRHQKLQNLKIREHNYRPDKSKLEQAEADLKAGKKLPPIRVNTDGDVLDNHHLLDLARKHGFSHIPIIVMGNPMLKRQVENQLREEVMMEDEDTGETQVITGGTPSSGSGEASEEITSSVAEFKNFTKKKYPKSYLMNQAKEQGIIWNEYTKSGKKLSGNSNILWMRAHQAIIAHLEEGHSFLVDHDEKQVNRKMESTGQDTIHKHFLKLLEKQGSKDNLMEWARDRDIFWKEQKDPLINWMNASVAIKKELAKGKMLDGVRTRQKKHMEEANLEVTDQIKSMVSEYGKKYGKKTVMDLAKSIGIEFKEVNAKGEPYKGNSRILWMNAHQAVARFIALGNDFPIGDDTGNEAQTGDYGDYQLTDLQGLAVDLGKRNSHNLEERSKDWSVKAFMADRGVPQEEAERLYEKLKEKSRESRLMVHFDPFETLPNGSLLLEQLSSDGSLKNDYHLNRGMDKDSREISERYLFGDEFDKASEQERPIYGVLDMLNEGLGSNPFGGEVAFVIGDKAKKRSTGTYIDPVSIPYGEETKWTRSVEDPHHMIVDRWVSRWKEPNNSDGQRKQLMDSVLNGEYIENPSDMFETQTLGDIDISKDVSHILVPKSWSSSEEHSEKYQALVGFAELMGIEVEHEEERQ